MLAMSGPLLLLPRADERARARVREADLEMAVGRVDLRASSRARKGPAWSGLSTTPLPFRPLSLEPSPLRSMSVSDLPPMADELKRKRCVPFRPWARSLAARLLPACVALARGHLLSRA